MSKGIISILTHQNAKPAFSGFLNRHDMAEDEKQRRVICKDKEHPALFQMCGSFSHLFCPKVDHGRSRMSKACHAFLRFSGAFAVSCSGALRCNRSARALYWPSSRSIATK